MLAPPRPDSVLARAAPWLLILATAAAPLAFRYLPMTDLPQHVAVASIIEHARDPAFGFAPYYRVDFGRAPYVLPYGLAVLLAQVMDTATAMRCVVALAIGAQLAGTLWLLTALGRPRRLLFLAIPFAFHQAFFWGFVHFQLGLGLAMMALALLARERSRASDAALLALVCGMASTHVYALLVFVAFAAILRLCGGADALRGRGPSLALACVATVWWFAAGLGQSGDGRSYDPSLALRLSTLRASVLGGWADRSEPTLLVFFLVAFVLLGWRSFPTTPARWKAIPPLERALWIAVLGNLALYFVVPQSTPTAKFVHFRHAVIAAVLLPALARWGPLAVRARLVSGTLLVVVGGGALLNAWDHLRLFDREARSFDRIVERIPARPRLAVLTFDKPGYVASVPAYLHFGAYVQAQRGGFMAASFPELFWNIPVALRDDAPAPRTPQDMEWQPRQFVTPQLTDFIDWVIVRRPGPQTLAASDEFPYAPVLVVPPWQLYLRRGPGAP